MPVKTCLALRHVAFEDLGILPAVLRRRHLEPRYLDVGVDALDRGRIDDADLLVVLGGPIGVYESEAYPYLPAEVETIRHRLAAGRPTLGICLGAQLMAKALGAAVTPGPAKEIGWAPIELTAHGHQSPLRHLADAPVLHWHGDRFALPEGATPLASTALCPHQAFSLGSTILALQFHVEADPKTIERWLIGHTVELAAAQIDVRTIREDTLRNGAQMVRIGSRIADDWLDGAGF